MSLHERLAMMDGDLPFFSGLLELTRRDYYHRKPFPAGVNERLGIPGVQFIDGPRGIVLEGGATCFPVAMARGATFDPDLEQLSRLSALPEASVVGFEINTDAYTRATGAAAEAELAKITAAVEFGSSTGFSVYAGHGLTTDNVGPVSAMAAIEELNIGHSIISRAALVGMDSAVREMLAAMAAADPSD